MPTYKEFLNGRLSSQQWILTEEATRPYRNPPNMENIGRRFRAVAPIVFFMIVLEFLKIYAESKLKLAIGRNTTCNDYSHTAGSGNSAGLSLSLCVEGFGS